MAATGNTGHQRIQVGDMTVTALNDGAAVYSTAILAGIDEAAADDMLRGAFRPVPPVITINAFLLQTGNRTILVDAGLGSERGDALGFVPRQLDAIGVAPASIDTVLMTHLHVDHAAGLLDKAGGARFPNATIVMHESERNFWLDEAKAAAAPEAAQPAFELANRAMAPYRDRIKTATIGDVAPGVSIDALPGHTPGHSGYLVRSGGDALLIWGDIVHMPALQFAKPEIGLTFDVDREQAYRTRRTVLERAAHERLRVAGMHHEFPAFGYIAKAGTGFAFVPELWMP